MVAEADAGSDPGTVVVVDLDAGVTSGAVKSSRGPPDVTGVAKAKHKSLPVDLHN
jgi:hypothetical protein